MKKLLIILALILSITGTSYAAGEVYQFVKSNVIINVNSEALQTETYNFNGKLFVPLRAVVEAIGVNVSYDETSNIASISTVDVDKLKESCVMINTSNGTGSGVFYDYGKVLTCYHVTDNSVKNIGYPNIGKELILLEYKNIKELDASILTSDNKNIKPCKLGDSDEVKIGDKIIIIGSPKRQKNTVFKGEVLELNEINNNIIGFTTSAISGSGSSGGGVFLERTGELIGIIEAGSQYDSFVIPINNIRKSIAN